MKKTHYISNLRQAVLLKGILVSAVIAIVLAYGIHIQLINSAKRHAKDVFFNFAQDVLDLGYSPIAKVDDATLHALAAKYYIQVATVYYGDESGVVLLPDPDKRNEPPSSVLPPSAILNFESDALKFRKGRDEIGILSINKLGNRIQLHGYIRQNSEKLYVNMGSDLQAVYQLRYDMMVWLFLLCLGTYLITSVLLQPIYNRFNRYLSQLTHVCNRWAKISINESFALRPELKQIMSEDNEIGQLATDLIKYNQKVEALATSNVISFSSKGLFESGTKRFFNHPHIEAVGHLNDDFSLVIAHHHIENDPRMVWFYGVLEVEGADPQSSCVLVRQLVAAYLSMSYEPSDILAALNRHLYDLPLTITLDAVLIVTQFETEQAQIAQTGQNVLPWQYRDNILSRIESVANPSLGQLSDSYFDFTVQPLMHQDIMICSIDDLLIKPGFTDQLNSIDLKQADTLCQPLFDLMPFFIKWKKEPFSIQDSLSVRFPNQLSELPKIQRVIDQFCAHHSISETTMTQLNLMTNEWVRKIMTHAFDPSQINNMELGLHYDQQRIELVLTDDGSPYNPLEDPDSKAFTAIQLTHRWASSIQYARENDHNKLIIMVVA